MEKELDIPVVPSTARRGLLRIDLLEEILEYLLQRHIDDPEAVKLLERLRKV